MQRKDIKIILCKGLPASGKSTWARQCIIDHPGTVRVCKDDLRAMLHSGIHSKGRENLVLAVRDFIVNKALAEGHDVVIDDTNFHPKHEECMMEIAAGHGVMVEIKDFTDVPLEVCIERDLQRANSVGERVIRQMHRQYIAPKIIPPMCDADLPDCVICDLDGTLALFDRDRVSPYDRDFSQDEVNLEVRDFLHMGDGHGYDIIILSGRKERHRVATEAWLKSYYIPYKSLYMRHDNDDRKDAIVKEEFYNEHVKDSYNVAAVLDDRLQVCRLWHRLGLPLFRVGDPDADF
jgi:predicted kinase